MIGVAFLDTNRPDNQESINALAGVNTFRGTFYLFLSRAFSKEVDKAFMQNVSEMISSLDDLSNHTDIFQEENVQKGKQLLKDFLKEGAEREEDIVLKDLARDYADLFLGVGGTTISLSESAFRSRTGLLFQDSFFEVKTKYEEIGLAKSEDFNEPDDHLSLELDYMAHLCRLSTDTLEKDRGKHLALLGDQRVFLEEHLIAWIPAFSGNLIETSQSKFYNAMAYLLIGYINVDAGLLDSLFEEFEGFDEEPKI